MAQAAYRVPVAPRQSAAIDPQLFPAVAVVDSPSLSASNAQRAAQTAYRPADRPRPRPVGPVDHLDLYEVDGAVGLGDVQVRAHALYRASAYPQQAAPFRPALLPPTAAADSPLLRQDTQIMARAAVRSSYATQQRIGMPLFLFSLDDPLPATQPQEAAQFAYRAPTFQQAARPNFAPLFDVPAVADSPQITSSAQEAALVAWRPVGRPHPLPPLFAMAIFPQVVEELPPVSMAQRLAILAYRGAGQPQHLPLLLYPGVFPPVVDDPPFPPPMGAQQASRIAYRPAWSPGGRGPAPFSIFDLPAVVDDPPLRVLVQQLARAAYRPESRGILAEAQRIVRLLPFDALFPPATIIPPTPSTGTIITGYATKADAKEIKADIASLRRDLRALIALLEKRGLKT